MKVEKEGAGRGYLPEVVRYKVENKKAGGRRPVGVERRECKLRNGLQKEGKREADRKTVRKG